MARRRATKPKPYLAAATWPATEDDVSYLPDDAKSADVNDKNNFAGTKLDKINRFYRYQQITEIDPIVFNGLMELGLELGKGFELGCQEDTELEENKQKEILKDANELVKRIRLDSMFCNAARLLCMNGSLPVLTSVSKEKDYYTDEADKESEGVTEVEFLPMRYTTFLTDHEIPGQGLNPAELGTRMPIIMGNVTQIVVNESNELYRKVYDDERCTIMRLFHETYEVKDIYARPTLGIYGRSLLDSIHDTIRYRHNIVDSYARAVNRYGHMKLWFEYEALSKLVENRAVEKKDADKFMQQAAQRIHELTSDEDIITSGFKVNPIETDMNVNIVPILAALENTITNGLLGTPATSGKTDNTTFASAYVAQQSKVLVKESIRREVKTSFEWIIGRHLETLGYNEDEIDAVVIKLDPIAEPQIDMPTLLTLLQAGKITDQQFFDLVGWNIKPVPMEQQMELQEQMMAMQLKYDPRVQTDNENGHSTNNPDSVSKTSGTAKKGARAERSTYKSGGDK